MAVCSELAEVTPCVVSGDLVGAENVVLKNCLLCIRNRYKLGAGGI